MFGFPGVNVKVLKQPESLQDHLAFYDVIDLTVGSRLHSCLLGVALGVPAICISYLPKCEYIMKDLGLSRYTLQIDSIQFLDILNLIKRVLEDKDYASTARSSLNRISKQFLPPFLDSISF